MEFMDIDGPEFLSNVNQEIASIRANLGDDRAYYDIAENSSTPSTGLDVYTEICVLDTNFLISKLGYLDTVLSMAEERPGSLLVLLPWVVIRELDGLKSRKGGDEICVRARKAMRFIESRLREKTVSLRGQKMNEILDPSMQLGDIKGDDRILDCCMYFHQITKKRVTLLSNDRNLCIKVMVHDIESISAESVPKMEALLNRIGIRKKQTEDYVMEIDEFYPQQGIHDEDYDMMIDDDEIITPIKSQQPKDSSASRWAKAPLSRHRKDDVPVYLDNDPTLCAPKKPPQNTSYSNSNHVPIYKDVSWTSIYSPK